MDDALFAASYIKLERARGFISELDAERARYVASGPAKAVMDISTNPPQIEVKWDGIGLLPGAIIGDAVHNLRASLDLMASELARINGKSDKGVYFPFAESESALLESEKFKKFSRCGQDCVEQLMRIKPYRGGNLPLRCVHDLDIMDKHRALIPTPNALNIDVNGQFSRRDPRINKFKADIRDVVFKFPETSALAGQEVIPTLGRLVDSFVGILQAFEGVVAARR